ncbi:MAG TPA: sodium:solute symporter family protein [Gemmatimonadales bacterium]|nr:sodium:solute symporter family protein [Gemmatimonadales bacterium]
MTPLFAAVLAYLVLQFGIGIWVSRRIRNESDYLLAGRRLGYPLMIFSIFATWFGAETMVGSAGLAYRDGVSLASAEPFGYALCLLLMGLVFATPLWHRKLTTLADLFRQRYSIPVERLAAVILIPSSLLWAAAQMRAFGQVLATTTTLPVEAALLAAAGFCILYTAFGGLLADAITDLVQGVLLVVGLLVLLGAVVLELGGVTSAVTAAVHSERIVPAGAGLPIWRTLEAWAVPVCGSVVATELVARIIAARSPRVARRSSFAAGAIYLAVGLIPVFIALAAPRLAGDLADPEQFLPTVARTLLPAAGYAIFAGGLISAILSTVDSTLLVSSGLLSHNLLVPLLGIRDQATIVHLARGGVVAFGLVAYVLALRSEGVFALVEQASAFGSTGSLVTVCFGLFTRWGGPRTAAATLVGGMASYVSASVGGLSYPFLTSLAVALGIYVTGALLERVVAPPHATAPAANGWTRT